MKPQLTSAIGLFGESYRLVRRNLNSYAIIYAVPAAVTVASVIDVLVNSKDADWGYGDAFSYSVFGPSLGADTSLPTASIILAVVIVVALIVTILMTTILNLRVSAGQTPSFGSLWQDFIRVWLWAKLIGLFVMMTILIVAGMIALIIPGVILIWRLFLAPYILVDKNTGVTEALSESWNMTRGYGWSIYSIILFSILLSLSGIIPLVGALISFALAVAYAAAPALRYQEIKTTK